jgi:hypothetical protein
VKYLVFGVWWSASCLSNDLQKDDWARSSTRLPAFPHTGLVEFGIAFSFLCLPITACYLRLASQSGFKGSRQLKSFRSIVNFNLENNIGDHRTLAYVCGLIKVS